MNAMSLPKDRHAPPHAAVIMPDVGALQALLVRVEDAAAADPTNAAGAGTDLQATTNCPRYRSILAKVREVSSCGCGCARLQVL